MATFDVRRSTFAFDVRVRRSAFSAQHEREPRTRTTNDEPRTTNHERRTTNDMRLVLSWLREFVDVTASAEDIARDARPARLRGRVDRAARRRRRGDRLRGHRQSTRLPERDRPRARGRHRLRPAAHAARRRRRRDGPAGGAVPLGASDRLTVSIDDDELCPRYAAAVADVRVGPSPAWMTARLQAAGVRPISSIVDITNYVNLELGQPMHAFDLARARRRARSACAAPSRARRITTLDGVDANARARHARHRRPRPRAGGRRRDGRRRLGGLGDDDHGGVRERVLQAGLGPAHEQAARPEDRGLVALRARRRHQRAGRRPPARDRADAADRRRPAGRTDRRLLPAAAPADGACTCAASGSRACSARRCPTPRSCGSCAGSASR